MLTRSRLKLGEGELIERDPEIGSRRTFSRTMSSPRVEEEGHENHHPFEVEKQVWLQITKERLKGCMEVGKVRKLYPHLLAE